MRWVCMSAAVAALMMVLGHGSKASLRETLQQGLKAQQETEQGIGFLAVYLIGSILIGAVDLAGEALSEVGNYQIHASLSYATTVSHGFRGVIWEDEAKECMGTVGSSRKSSFSATETSFSGNTPRKLILYPNIDNDAETVADLPSSTITEITIATGKEVSPGPSNNGGYNVPYAVTYTKDMLEMCGYGSSGMVVNPTESIVIDLEYLLHHAIPCFSDYVGRSYDLAVLCKVNLCNGISKRDASSINDSIVKDGLNGGNCAAQKSLAATMLSKTATSVTPAEIENTGDTEFESSSTLGVNSGLLKNDKLYSNNKQYYMTVSDDGYVEMYTDYGLRTYRSSSGCGSGKVAALHVLVSSERSSVLGVDNSKIHLFCDGEIEVSLVSSFDGLRITNQGYYTATSGCQSSVIDHFVFYDGSNCGGSKIATYGIPPLYSEYSDLMNDRWCGANDKAKSLRIYGPLPANVRVRVYDNRNQDIEDDVAIIQLQKAIPSGSSICVGTFHGDDSGSTYLRNNLYINGLDGKVSSVRVEHWSTGWMNVVSKGLQWIDKFSDETPRSTYLNDGPVMGISCSGGHCDNKRLLQAELSGCIGSTYQWTGWFSEEAGKWYNCPSGWYLARMECRNSYCDRIRFACRSTSSACTVSSSFSTVEYIEGTNFFECPAGEVVTGLKCFNSYCGKLGITCSKINT